MNAAASIEREETELLSVLGAAVVRAFGQLRRSVQNNLAVLTVAVVRVPGAARSGHGRLSFIPGAAIGKWKLGVGKPAAVPEVFGAGDSGQ